MNQSRLWLAVVLVAASTASLAQEPVILVPGAESVPLAGHIEVLRDDGANLSFADVRTPEVAGRFAPGGADDAINWGVETAPYWYRFALANADSPASTEWVLELEWPVLDYVDLHVTRRDGTVESSLSGDLRQPAAGQLPFHTFAFPLRLEPGEIVTAHLRVQTEGRHSVQLLAWTRAGFDEHAARENVIYGAFFGMVLVMALHNLIVFLWIRDRAYFWYVLSLVALGTIALLVAGYARQHGNALAAGAPAWINGATPYAQIAVGICGAMFAREFMQARRDAPGWDRAMIVYVVACAAMLALCPLLDYNTAGRLNLVLGAAGAITMLLVGIVLSLRGLRAARFYLLAFGALLVSLFVALLPAWRVLPPGNFADNAWQVGVWLHAILLSLALADRITQERREKFLARESANRLKSFLPGRVAELVSGGDKTLLAPKRREVTVCVIDLRGFTPFSETSAPEDVMNVLREFYETMGAIVERHGGTVEHFAGDSMLIFFNAPLEIEKHEEHAVRAALEMRAAFEPLREKWIKLGHELGLGIGIADGYATIGAIGFSGRSQYAAIGAVTNLAARLCSEAKHGEVLTTSRVLHAIEAMVNAEPGGEKPIRGFSKPISVVRVLQLKAMPGAA